MLPDRMEDGTAQSGPPLRQGLGSEYKSQSMQEQVIRMEKGEATHIHGQGEERLDRYVSGKGRGYIHAWIRRKEAK